MERDVQGYGMFGGISMDVCGGPGLHRGGASRRINGRGLWRGEMQGEEGESGPLWQGAIRHPPTQAHSLPHVYTAAETGLSPLPMDVTLPLREPAAGGIAICQQPLIIAFTQAHAHTHTCGFSTPALIIRPSNSRLRRACVLIGTNG